MTEDGRQTPDDGHQTGEEGQQLKTEDGLPTEAQRAKAGPSFA